MPPPSPPQPTELRGEQMPGTCAPPPVQPHPLLCGSRREGPGPAKAGNAPFAQCLGPGSVSVLLLVRFHNRLSSWLTLLLMQRQRGKYILLVSLCLWCFYSMYYSQIEFCTLYLFEYLHLKRESLSKPTLEREFLIFGACCLLLLFT